MISSAGIFLALATVTVDSPRVELDLPREVQAGAPVRIALRVTNTSERPLALQLRGRPIAFDLVVKRKDGSVLWRRLAGAMIAMVLQQRTLAPGETLELSDVWRQQTADGTAAASGEYSVIGSLLTASPMSLESCPVTLRIRARR